MQDGYDWERFWIHFVFGALLGVFIWVVFSARYSIFGIASWHWPWAAGFCLAMALLGGIFGDRFWTWFLENLRWFRWW